MTPEEFDELLLNGAIEPAGIDMKTGEMLYNFTDKLKTFSPDIFDAISNAFYNDLVSLWSFGFLDMDITQENPTVRITDKIYDSDLLEQLDQNALDALSVILHKIQEKEQ